MCGGLLVLFYKVDKEQAKSIGQHFQFSVISQKENDVAAVLNLPPAWLQGFHSPSSTGRQREAFTPHMA